MFQVNKIDLKTISEVALDISKMLKDSSCYESKFKLDAYLISEGGHDEWDDSTDNKQLFLAIG